MKMPGTFSAQDDSRRYRHWQAWRILTSPPFIIGFILPLTFVFGCGAVWWLGVLTLSPVLITSLWFLSSVSLGFLLILAFATTYYPYVPPKFTAYALMTAGRGDIMDAAEFTLVGILHQGRRLTDAERLSLLFAALLTTTVGKRWLARLQLEAQSVQAEINYIFGNLSWSQYCQDLLAVTRSFGSEQITIEHALTAFMLQSDLKNFLRDSDLQEKDVIFVAWWLASLRYMHVAAKRWWDEERFLSFTGVGLSWTAGYTPLVDRFARFPHGNLWDRYTEGRREQLGQLIDTLARFEQSNVLLVGQPGVGRFGLVRELARRVMQNRAHPALNGQKVVYLHIGELLGQASTSASQLSIISQVLREMELAGNIIAVIDGLGSVLGEDGESRVNLTEVLLPFFSAITVRVVVIISSDEYHLRLKSNEELVHLFEVVQVPSASPDQTLQSLALVIEAIEHRSGVTISYQTLRSLVRTTQGVLQNIPYPERAFDVLEEALVVAQAANAKVLTEEVVTGVVSRKVGVLVGRVRQSERDYLLNLEDIMHRFVVNQHQAITAIARAMIRARAGVRDTTKPIGTFLFLGPTGVGKTETAKTLARTYFGSEDYLSRLDMSEYQGQSGVDRLLGSTAAPVGRLSALMSAQPFTVLLLDEFEKAHPMVHQLFLQILDEGQVTDVRGQHVSFNHAIIIATSNAGAELIRTTIAKNQELPLGFEQELREHILTKEIFRPELLNRFDGVITFTPLSREHIAEVAKIMLQSLNRRLDAEHGVTVAITAELVEYLCTIGYDPEFGARPMARALKNTVEYAVAKMVLQGELRPGQQITLTPAQLQALLTTDTNLT